MGVTNVGNVSLGLNPYVDKRWGTQFMNDLLQGVRLQQPKYASEEV